MEISNNDLARILGKIEANVQTIKDSQDEQKASLQRLESSISARIDRHDDRLRAIEAANPAKANETLGAHNERLSTLEKNSAKAGAVAGLGASVLIAAIVEYVKRKM